MNAARTAIDTYAMVKYDYVREVDAHSHWIGLSMILIVLGAIFDRVGFSPRGAKLSRVVIASRLRRVSIRSDFAGNAPRKLSFFRNRDRRIGARHRRYGRNRIRFGNAPPAGFESGFLVENGFLTEGRIGMYPRSFHYHRAGSLEEASAMLSEFGDEAKLLAGGQSLIPLMKLRYANPNHLVDLNFISGTSYIKEENGTAAVRSADPPR